MKSKPLGALSGRDSFLIKIKVVKLKTKTISTTTINDNNCG
ncbi:UNVERIFIED_CONTAM: hypothetical protein O8I53_08180 [Campylobacter lari]